VNSGGGCLTCHNGAEEKLDNKLVAVNPLEPTPVAGKNGVIQLNLQIAYDNANAYFRAQWRTRNPYPGEAHQFLRFDGKEWKTYGFPKLDQVVQKGELPGIYEDRFSIMIDDGGVPALQTTVAGSHAMMASATTPSLRTGHKLRRIHYIRL
jgi:hypothetical protein